MRVEDGRHVVDMDAPGALCLQREQACGSSGVWCRACVRRGHRDGERVSSHHEDVHGHAELLHGYARFNEHSAAGQWELDN